MPYNPGKVSEGGNQGIDDQFSRVAPEGMFRVVGVDTFDGTDWIEGDCPTLTEARDLIREQTKGQKMLKYYIYDDTGKLIYSKGKF